MSTFRFKQFSIQQQNAAMKIGTDGVLLGGWITHQVKSAERILDIGTGTGLIALMLAQHYNEAQVDAVERSNSACLDASVNFSNSPFSSRLTLHETDILDFQSLGSFDLIVSNPPYFQNSLHAATQDRTEARHQSGLTLADLLKKASSLSSSDGLLGLILPHDLLANCLNLGKEVGWNAKHICNVRGRNDRPIKRNLILFSKLQYEPEYSELIIELSRHVYTDEYIELTREYYLKM